MPALPWKAISALEPDEACVAMASRLPLARHRDIPRFMRATLAIRRQLATSKGLIGYALDAHLAARTFWTVSAWRSDDALKLFSREDPHRTRVAGIRPMMQTSTFVFWPCTGRDLPIAWTEARRRLDTAT